MNDWFVQNYDVFFLFNWYQMLKVFMKRNFLPQFFNCMRKISKNHNITSFIEFV